MHYDAIFFQKIPQSYFGLYLKLNLPIFFHQKQQSHAHTSNSIQLEYISSIYDFWIDSIFHLLILEQYVNIYMSYLKNNRISIKNPYTDYFRNFNQYKWIRYCFQFQILMSELEIPDIISIIQTVDLSKSVYRIENFEEFIDNI